MPTSIDFGREFKASVFVNGIELREYKEETVGTTTSSYIESEVGQEYTIVFNDGRFIKDTDLRVELSIDGVVMQSFVSHKYSLRPVTFRGKKISDSLEAPFVFSRINLVEEDSGNVCTDPEIIRNLGSISIKIFRGLIGRVIPASTYPPVVNNHMENAFSEKSKKAILSNQTTLGQARKVQYGNTFDFQPFDIQQAPYCEFKFFYRSRDLLEAQEIIEPLPEVKEQEIKAEIKPRVKAENKDIIPLDLDEEKPNKKRKVIEIDDDDTEVKPQPYKKFKDKNGRIIIELD